MTSEAFRARLAALLEDLAATEAGQVVTAVIAYGRRAAGSSQDER